MSHLISGETLSTKGLWTGRFLSWIAVLFLAFDATLKVLRLLPAVEATTQLGYPQSVIVPLGLVQLACLIVYLIPRTSVLGAVLWTGYLGGAVATHVRVGSAREDTDVEMDVQWCARLRQRPASGSTIVLTAMSHALAADAARARMPSAANR